jgi:hypothetical protein
MHTSFGRLLLARVSLAKSLGLKRVLRGHEAAIVATSLAGTSILHSIFSSWSRQGTVC